MTVNFNSEAIEIIQEDEGEIQEYIENNGEGIDEIQDEIEGDKLIEKKGSSRLANIKATLLNLQ